MQDTSNLLNFLIPASPRGKEYVDSNQYTGPSEKKEISIASSQPMIDMIAKAIIYQPEKLQQILHLPAHSSRLEIKDALMKKMAENDETFNSQLISILKAQSAKTGYSNLFGLDTLVTGLIGVVFGSGNAATLDSGVTTQLVQIQQDKLKAARQNALIGFGIFGALVLTTTIILVSTSKK